MISLPPSDSVHHPNNTVTGLASVTVGGKKKILYVRDRLYVLGLQEISDDITSREKPLTSKEKRFSVAEIISHVYELTKTE